MEDIDENGLQWARGFKKKLRFDIGDVVYLNSDVSKKCPITIMRIEVFDTAYDYDGSWIKSSKNIDNGLFLDKTLCK